MQLRAHASIEIPQPGPKVFDYACAAENFPTIMKSRGPIPGVVKVTLIDAQALAAGVRRNVELSDKSTLIEEVTAHESPSRHAYRWASKLKFPLSMLVSGAAAEWTFSPSGAGTRIDWNYTFTPTTVLLYPITAIMVGQFRGWMNQTLATLRDALK